MVESQNSLIWKGPKSHLVHGHHPLNQISQGPIQLGLEHFQEWRTSTSRDNLFQCLTTLKDVFFMSSLNLSSFSFKPLCPVLSLQALVKVSLHLVHKPPLCTERPQTGFPRAFFPRLSKPSYLSLSSYAPFYTVCGSTTAVAAIF